MDELTNLNFLGLIILEFLFQWLILADSCMQFLSWEIFVLLTIIILAFNYSKIMTVCRYKRRMFGSNANFAEEVSGSHRL